MWKLQIIGFKWSLMYVTRESGSLLTVYAKYNKVVINSIKNGYLAHAANKYTKGQQCTFREDVGKGSPPKYRKSGKPVEKLVSEWKQGDQIVPLLKPGDLMELKHTEGTHWMIYVGGPRLEYIHTSHKSQPSINWTSVQKSSLLTSCQRWMIRKNNHLDSKYKHYSPSQVVQRAEALVKEVYSKVLSRSRWFWNSS
uniref:LRAT domain-containing protein n=1 Tax=Ditylenchus dipsaci TaxID=166011 RepID=A0A915DKA7_9BILA